MLHSHQRKILAWNLIQTKINFVDKFFEANINGVDIVTKQIGFFFNACLKIKI